MGNAMVFYFPLPDARSLVTIDLGEGLGELFSEYEYDVAQSISRGGRRYLSHGLQREFVTIQRDRMISSSTSAEFASPASAASLNLYSLSAKVADSPVVLENEKK